METLQRTMDVAFYGNFHACQCVARWMAEHRRGGSIIIIGSVHAVYPLRKAFDYNVAKAAVHHMANIMANELAPYRIRVNTVIPGWIDTPGERKWVPDEELYRQGARLPWGRLGTPEDVANVVTFLASDAAEYVSGSTYHVDGAVGGLDAGGRQQQSQGRGRPLMRYRQIPGTGLNPSVIVLGTVSFGSGFSREDSWRMLDAFAEAGGTFIDTAHNYADWASSERSASEKTIGEWLARTNVRNRMVVATKGASLDLRTRASAGESRGDPH